VLAVFVLEGHLHPVLGLAGRGDTSAEPDIQALVFELTQRVAGDLLIRQSQKILDRFQHDDLGAHPVPHAAQLQADHAGADHAERLGHLAKIQGAGRIDDQPLAVVYRRGTDVDPARHRCRLAWTQWR